MQQTVIHSVHEADHQLACGGRIMHWQNRMQFQQRQRELDLGFSDAALQRKHWITPLCCHCCGHLPFRGVTEAGEDVTDSASVGTLLLQGELQLVVVDAASGEQNEPEGNAESASQRGCNSGTAQLRQSILNKFFETIGAAIPLVTDAYAFPLPGNVLQ